MFKKSASAKRKVNFKCFWRPKCNKKAFPFIFRARRTSQIFDVLLKSGKLGKHAPKIWGRKMWTSRRSKFLLSLSLSLTFRLYFPLYFRFQNANKRKENLVWAKKKKKNYTHTQRDKQKTNINCWMWKKRIFFFLYFSFWRCVWSQSSSRSTFSTVALHSGWITLFNFYFFTGVFQKDDIACVKVFWGELNLLRPRAQWLVCLTFFELTKIQFWLENT